MSIVQTEWWCIELPDEWSAEMDDDCVSITDCDNVGTIDVSAIRKEEGLVSEQDLKDLAEELIADGFEFQRVTIAGSKGLLFSYQEEDVAWREWYLAHDSLVLYATYNTEVEHSGLDDAMVDEILSTLVFLDE